MHYYSPNGRSTGYVVKTWSLMSALAIGRLAISVEMTPKKIIFNKLNNNDLSVHAWVNIGKIETFLGMRVIPTYDKWCLGYFPQKFKTIKTRVTFE